MHTTERYQYCVFPENVRPCLRIATVPRLWGRGGSARRWLKNEPIGHYVRYSSEWCWMNLASVPEVSRVGIPVIISKNKERFVEGAKGDCFRRGDL